MDSEEYEMLLEELDLTIAEEEYIELDECEVLDELICEDEFTSSKALSEFGLLQAVSQTNNEK